VKRIFGSDILSICIREVEDIRMELEAVTAAQVPWQPPRIGNICDNRMGSHRHGTNVIMQQVFSIGKFA
jgi:hypothetical protein